MSYVAEHWPQIAAALLGLSIVGAVYMRRRRRRSSGPRGSGSGRAGPGGRQVNR